MRLTGQGANASAFLPAGFSTATNSLNATNQVVEIQSSSYEIRTNSAEFRSGVQVLERVAGQPRSKLTCANLTVHFAGTNQMESMVAQHNVIMEQGLKRFTAEDAVFTGTNQILTLTGNPTWQDGPRAGKGDVIFLDGRQDELTARGNASLHLPAANIAPAEFGAAKTPSSPNPTNQIAEISSAEYTLGTNSASFLGGVSVKHPQMNMNCKTLNLHGDAMTHNLVARDTITFDLMSEKDQKIHGTGQKAVYTYGVVGGRTNDLLELTGKPVLSMADGSTFENDIIILDRANGMLKAPGKYRIRQPLKPGATNAIHLPAPADLLKSAPKKKHKSST
jgi:lipopolysaccharide export system protein LptA